MDAKHHFICAGAALIFFLFNFGFFVNSIVSQLGLTTVIQSLITFIVFLGLSIFHVKEGLSDEH